MLSHLYCSPPLYCLASLCMQRKHAKGLHDVVAVPLLELDNDKLTFNIMARLCRCHLKGLTRPLSSESPRLYLHVKHLLTLAPPRSLFPLTLTPSLSLVPPKPHAHQCRRVSAFMGSDLSTVTPIMHLTLVILRDHDPALVKFLSRCSPSQH